MRQEKFKMERQGLIEIGDEVEITEYQSFMNYSYIIEPAVAMSGCYPNALKSASLAERSPPQIAMGSKKPERSNCAS